VDVRKEGRQRRYALKRERYSRAVHGQESQKAQQKRRIGKGRSDEPSKC